MEKRYFTAVDFDKMIYFQMPKVLMYADKYEKLSNDAKILYMYCLDLMKISMSNHGRRDKNGNIQSWKDENGFYIKLSLDKIQQIVRCGKNKAVELKKELEKYSLLEQKRVGLNKANLLYVLQLEYTEEDIYRVNEEIENLLEEDENSSSSREVRKSNFRNTENQTSESLKIKPQEVSKSNTNNNKSSNTKLIDNQDINTQLPNSFEEEEDKNNNINGETGFEADAQIAEDVMFSVLTDILIEHGVNSKIITKVILELKNRSLTIFQVSDIQAQLNHMYSLLKNGEPIYNFAVYFANGLEERTFSSQFAQTTRTIEELKQQLEEQLKVYQKPSFTFYDWLNERG